MFLIEFTHNKAALGPRTLVKHKATMASAVNLVYKVHSSLSHNLVSFKVRYNEDEWAEYDVPWVNSHAAIKARLHEIIEFHVVFYP